ncbi:hypothetical protein EDB89DRAFT_2080039 [Lactarius sanguifluus]|nr:hypothetical protein EDB89DRAFT_2080039 [Lactarius sanguifluus]
MSLVSDYDFSQFGHWDGDSASYYEEYDHYTPPGPSRQSSQPRRLPSPLTPLASPSAFVQEFVQGSSTSGTQYEYTLTDIHGELPSGLPSPISRPTTPRPATPLEYGEEAFSPIFDIRTQVAVRSVPLREPTPELVYPDPPSEPTPSPRPVSAPPRIPSPPPHNQSRASTPPRVPTPDSPIDYERVAEQSPVDSTATDLPSEWENILPASFFHSPSCVNSPEEHPHLFTAVYSAEGESWRPASVTIREHFSRIPLAPALARAFPVFPSVTPFRIPPPHLYTILPCLIDPTNAASFPPLYICSKAILDLPSTNLPLGSVRYDFREGIRQAFAPLSNILRAGYIDSLFDTHRDRQLRRYYPSTSYYNISESSRIDSWVDPPLVLKSLVNLFEFGETWDTYAFNDFQDDLSAVVDACNDQLLFWHLSDRTPEQLVLWTKSDYLWFNHIPPRRDYLIQQLQAGNSVRYLDRFRLSYEEIEIAFHEIRVVDREGPPSLVITEGTELTYSWERATWETTLNNPDHNLVNPRIYHEPPTDPNDPELVELLTARRTNPLSLLARLSLPASSPETEETNNSSNDDQDNPHKRFQARNSHISSNNSPVILQTPKKNSDTATNPGCKATLPDPPMNADMSMSSPPLMFESNGSSEIPISFDSSTTPSHTPSNEFYGNEPDVPPKDGHPTSQDTTSNVLVDRAREPHNETSPSSNPLSHFKMKQDSRLRRKLCLYCGNEGHIRQNCKLKRGILIEDDNVNGNASSLQPEQFQRKFTKVEKDHWLQDKLCLYCGNKGHTLQECKFKRGILVEDDSNKDASSTQSAQTQEIPIEDDNVKVNTSSFRSEQPRGKLTKAERDRRFQEQLCLYCGNSGHILRECKLKTQSMRARGGHPSHNKDKVQGTFVEETLDQEDTPENLPAQIGAFHFEDCKRLAINHASVGRSNNEEVRNTVVEERDQEDDPADFWASSEARYREILPYSPDAGPRSL